MKSIIIGLFIFCFTGFASINAQQKNNVEYYESLFPKQQQLQSISGTTKVAVEKKIDKTKSETIKKLSKEYYTKGNSDNVIIHIMPFDGSLIFYNDFKPPKDSVEIIENKKHVKVPYKRIIYKSLSCIKYTMDGSKIYKLLVNKSGIQGTVTAITKSMQDDKYIFKYFDSMNFNEIKKFIEVNNSLVSEFNEITKTVEIDDPFLDDFTPDLNDISYNESLFPKTLPGWTSTIAKYEEMNDDSKKIYSFLEKDYFNDKEKLEIYITIDVHGGNLSNKEILNSADSYKYKSYKGYRIVYKEDNFETIVVLLHNKGNITIEANEFSKNEKNMLKYLDMADLTAIISYIKYMQSSIK